MKVKEESEKVSSSRWWWPGRPGVLQSMGSQRVRNDWVTELNWLNWGFNKQAYWLNHWPLVIDLNLSDLPSHQRCRKYKTFLTMFEYLCWELLDCMVLKLCSRNHHLTYEREYIARVSGGLVHETGKWSNMNRKKTVKKDKGRSLETLVILSQAWTHSLPHRGCVSCFPCSSSPQWLHIFQLVFIIEK